MSKQQPPSEITFSDLHRATISSMLGAPAQSHIPPLLTRVPDGVALLNDEGFIVDVNTAACRLLGYRRSALLGCTLASFIHPQHQSEELPNVMPPYIQVMKGSLHLICAFAIERTVEYTLTPEAMPHYHLLMFRGLEREAEHYKVASTVAVPPQQAMDWLAEVSHELRTPLTSLHSALKILVTGQLGSLSADGHRMLAIADANTERLLRLVNNLLDWQRLESGMVVSNKQACPADELITQASEAMQAMAQEHQVTLIPQATNMTVVADADYIVQVLINLLSNAIKFSEPGDRVWLTVTAQQHTSLGPSCSPTASVPAAPPAFSRQAIFRVQDEGQGIPTEHLERIFERFQRGNFCNSRKNSGTGLGLTICRKIIEQHDGRIWAESTPGVGSIFSFTLLAVDE